MRRNELQSPASSPRSSPDPEILELLRSRVQDDFTFTTASAPEASDAIGTARDEEDTELVLFAAPTSFAPQTHKIRINSPGPETGEGGFIVKRPHNYYFADDHDSGKEAEYHAAAVNAEAVLAMSKAPWPGCSLPWKVRTILPAGIRKSVLVGYPKVLLTMEEKGRRRKRRGKKSRIAIRKKLRAKEERRAGEERARKEVEDAEREKRTRKNREKKVKKKEREKAKKLAVASESTEQSS